HHYDGKILPSAANITFPTGRIRLWTMFVTDAEAFLSVMAVNHPAQYIYVANGKAIRTVHASDFTTVSESEKHEVGEWLSLCFDARTSQLYGIARLGESEGSTDLAVFRSNDGGKKFTESLTFTSKSARLERGSEQNWLILLYEEAGEEGIVKARVSRDGTKTWEAAKDTLEGEEPLTGAVLDLEQDSRANNTFYLTLGQRGEDDESTEIVNARYFRSSDAGTGCHWKEIYTLTGNSHQVERDSERQWFVALRQKVADGTLDRHLTRDNGNTWIDPVPAKSGGEVLIGRVIDLEQNPRANGAFYMTLAQTNEEGETVSTAILKSLDSGITWSVIAGDRTKFILDTDALDGPMVLA
ncbi:MAG: hypothetical protein V4671_04325, partial [Armatimonadota bacterium]